jgi:hypothetical protein
MVPYQGQPVSLLIAKLGYPTEQQVIAGNKVYIWTTSNFVEGTNYACRIRAILNSQDIIMSWDGNGNNGGCLEFASKLGG